MQVSQYTFRLFARPSVVEGIARVMDLGGVLQQYNNEESANDDDLMALRGDWMAIGEDLRSAYARYERKSGNIRQAGFGQ